MLQHIQGIDLANFRLRVFLFALVWIILAVISRDFSVTLLWRNFRGCAWGMQEGISCQARADSGENQSQPHDTSQNIEYLLLFCKQVFSKYTCSIFPVMPHKCIELISRYSCFQVRCLLTEYCKPFTESKHLIGNYDQLLQQTDSPCYTWLIKKHKCCF